MQAILGTSSSLHRLAERPQVSRAEGLSNEVRARFEMPSPERALHKSYFVWVLNSREGVAQRSTLLAASGGRK